MDVPSSARPASTGRHEHVLGALGTAIAAGDLAPGSVLRLEDVEARHGVSRTVAREAVRVLESMGLITSRRRVGLTVQPTHGWNVYDPRVIRWRLAGPDRDAQLRSLTALRSAVEPAAAAGAALHADPAASAELVATAGRMTRLGEAGDLAAFLDADIAFHRLLLVSCGNEMFAALAGVVAEVLTGRTVHDLMPAHPEPVALALHRAVADAVLTRDPAAAATAMSALTAEVRTGLDGRG